VKSAQVLKQTDAVGFCVPLSKHYIRSRHAKSQRIRYRNRGLM